MSHDEILATVYAEQGYIVLATNLICEIGSIHHGAFPESDDRPRWPMRFIAPSNYAEFAAQVRRMRELVDDDHDRPVARDRDCYYRMEPTD